MEIMVNWFKMGFYMFKFSMEKHGTCLVDQNSGFTVNV